MMDSICLNYVIHPRSNEARIAKIRNHEVDIDIGGLLPNDSSIISHKLFTSKIKAMVNINHPFIQTKLTMEDWNTSKHVQWIQTPGESLVLDGNANQMDALLNRNISYKSVSTLNTIMMCAMSDSIMSVPEYLQSFMEKYFPVRFFDVPFETTQHSAIYVHFHRSAKRKEFIGECLDALIEMVPATAEA
jgi:DNA-binding transcriptional LysR family regulator